MIIYGTESVKRGLRGARDVPKPRHSFCRAGAGRSRVSRSWLVYGKKFGLNPDFMERIRMFGV